MQLTPLDTLVSIGALNMEGLTPSALSCKIVKVHVSYDQGGSTWDFYVMAASIVTDAALASAIANALGPIDSRQCEVLVTVLSTMTTLTDTRFNNWKTALKSYFPLVDYTSLIETLGLFDPGCYPLPAIKLASATDIMAAANAGSIAAVKTVVDSNATKADTITTKVNTIDTNVNTIKTDVGTTKANVITVDTVVDAIKVKVDTLNNYNDADIQSDVVNVKAVVDSIKSTLESLVANGDATVRADVSTILTKVNSLNNYSDALVLAELESISGQISAMPAPDDSNTIAQIAIVKAAIDGVTATVNKVKSAVTLPDSL